MQEGSALANPLTAVPNSAARRKSALPLTVLMALVCDAAFKCSLTLAGRDLQTLIPALAGAASGGMDVTSVIGQLVGAGASGAILTVIVALVKNMMAGQRA